RILDHVAYRLERASRFAAGGNLILEVSQHFPEHAEMAVVVSGLSAFTLLHDHRDRCVSRRTICDTDDVRKIDDVLADLSLRVTNEQLLLRNSMKGRTHQSIEFADGEILGARCLIER